MYAQYFADLFSHRVPNASVSDTTAPTFAGITGAVANTDGSLTAQWSAATDATPPIEFIIYIALGSVNAAALFQSANIVTISPANTLSKNVINLADQETYLVKGEQYTLGVRAKDALGNINTNTAIQVITAVASGNLPEVYQQIATDLQITESFLGSIASAIAGGGGTMMSFEVLETTMTIETDGVD